MDILEALFLSFVEGVTEFLPISSTAHLILASQLLNIKQDDFVKSFEIIIQFGAILAVVVLYFTELVKNFWLWGKILQAFIPSVIIGFLSYGFIKEDLLGNQTITALALILGGIVFTLADKLIPKATQKNAQNYVPESTSKSFESIKDHVSLKTITTKKLLAIGFFQSLAMVPGVSRAAASILGGLIVGLNKTEATKFSFFLAIPTMLAAASLDLFKSGLNFSHQQLMLLSLGLIGSFVTALITVKLFISFVQKHSFLPFGIYRILIGLVWIFFL